MPNIPNEEPGLVCWCRICQTPFTRVAGLDMPRKCPTCNGVAVNGASIWTTLAPVILEPVPTMPPRKWALTPGDRRLLKALRIGLD